MTTTMDSRPYKLSFLSFLTGHHVYKECWTPEIEEKLECSREPDNQHDPHAVAAFKQEMVVGHIPRSISMPCSYALLAGATIEATVIGKRENKRKNGLEVPVEYRIKGPHKHMTRAETFISMRMKL